MRDKKDFSKEEIEKAVAESKSYRSLARKLGYNDNTGHYTSDVEKWIKKYNCDISHFKGQGINALEYDDVLKDKSINSKTLMNFLLNTVGKERKCECCGNTEWNGQPIPLQVHHIDGNHYNNNIDNLQILCLNCHAQTDNFGNKKMNHVPDEQIIGAIETSYNVSEVLRKVKISDCKLSRDRIKQIISNGHSLLKKEKVIKDCNKNKEKSDFQKFQEKKFTKRKEYFYNSNIDFTKYGWQTKVEKALGISHTQVMRWLKKYMPEFEVYRRQCPGGETGKTQ